MNATMRRKLTYSVAGCILAILFFLPSELRLSLIDDPTDAYFSDSIIEAGAAYTSCRILNASVSVVKESSLQLEPAGVGVSLAVGQVLDPIDDMTERLSGILVTAITSLGVQKLLYEIGISLVLPMVSALLLLLSAVIWFDHHRMQSLAQFILRLSLLFLIARVCLPFSALANSYIHEHFFAEKLETALSELSVGSAELEKLGDVSLPEVDGVLGTIENSSLLLKQKATDFKVALVSTANNMSTIIEALLELAYLYIGMFVFQILFLPLLAFWILVKTTSSLFNIAIPVIITHSRNDKG